MSIASLRLPPKLRAPQLRVPEVRANQGLFRSRAIWFDLAASREREATIPIKNRDDVAAKDDARADRRGGADGARVDVQCIFKKKLLCWE
jgi:hypothetical protein